MAIGRPRGKAGMRPIYVYSPALGRKVYVGSRKNLRGDDGAKALEIAKTIEFARADPTDNTITITAYATEWFELHHGPGTRRPAPGTLTVNTGNLRPFLKDFGTRPIDGGIQRREALRWSKLHPHNAVVVCAMFNDAINDEICKTNPFAGSVQTCVTSPPYFGLRDYGHDGQIGLEPTPDEFVAALVEVFREVRRVLRDDGTVWLNLGDSYNAYNGNRGPAAGINAPADQQRNAPARGLTWTGAKTKDLIGIPWMVAFALRADGWYLRSDIIWSKPNPMPESVTDRPTKAHEYVFLLSKSARYFYDADAIREAPAERTLDQIETDRRAGLYESAATGLSATTARPQFGDDRFDPAGRFRTMLHPNGRNKRSVWAVATQPYPGAHFATFPPKLIEPCILAGCPEGGTVLDPFAGAGTTGMVALRHSRSFIGCELNPEYVRLARGRIIADAPLLNTHAEAA